MRNAIIEKPGPRLATKPVINASEDDAHMRAGILPMTTMGNLILRWLPIKHTGKNKRHRKGFVHDASCFCGRTLSLSRTEPS